MIYSIKEWDDPILRAVAEPVGVVDEDIMNIIKNMVETMLHIQAAGLAANQCGIPLRIMLVGKAPSFSMPLICINPEISFYSPETVVNSEGCFSLPGVYGSVRRPARITLKYKLVNGVTMERPLDYHDWSGVVAQHELDHLDGIFFTDYATDFWEDPNAVTATYKGHS